MRPQQPLKTPREEKGGHKENRCVCETDLFLPFSEPEKLERGWQRPTQGWRAGRRHRGGAGPSRCGQLPHGDSGRGARTTEEGAGAEARCAHPTAGPTFRPPGAGCARAWLPAAAPSLRSDTAPGRARISSSATQPPGRRVSRTRDLRGQNHLSPEQA